MRNLNTWLNVGVIKDAQFIFGQIVCNLGSHFVFFFQAVMQFDKKSIFVHECERGNKKKDKDNLSLWRTFLHKWSLTPSFLGV